jgi:NADPH-dependent ferric siderophore reductase
VTAHAITRVRQAPRRRTLAVSRVDALTPRMRRISFISEDLRDFSSASADDHIKLFFADSGQPCMRDFTPRAFHPAQGTLVIDFALHDAGPATMWAASAQVGQTLAIGGPRGSLVVPDDFDWYLLIGDETALPAIGRRVEELRAEVPVTTLVVIQNVSEAQIWDTRAAWSPIWLSRDVTGNDDSASLRAAIAGLKMPGGDGFIWIAAEGSVARAARNYLFESCWPGASWLGRGPLRNGSSAAFSR